MSEVIRPFRGLDRLENLLDDHVTRYANGTVDRPRVTLTTDSVRTCDARIEAVVDAARFELEAKRAGLDAKDIEVIAYRTSATRRLTEYLDRKVWSPGLKTLEIRTERRKDVAGDLLYREGSGFTLGIAFVLRQNIEREPLRPFLKGTWLADAKLEVRSREEAMDGITPHKLTAERIAELQEQGIKVGPATLTYVQFTGSLISSDLLQCVDIYIHEQLGAAMDGHELNPSSLDETKLRFQVARMSVDVITAVAARAYLEVKRESGELEPNGSTVEEALSGNPGLASFLSKPVRRAGGQGGRSDLEIAVDLVKMAGIEPGQLRSFVEDCYGVGNSLLSTLGD
jgi:hypothetical protein